MSINSYGALFTTKTLTPEIRKAATATQRYATLLVKANTPVRTGNMRSQWQVKQEAAGLRFENDAHYAIYVEMGTRFMRARRPLGRALPAITSHFKSQLAKEVGAKLGAEIAGYPVISPATFQKAKPLNTRVFNALTKGTPDRAFRKGFGNNVASKFEGKGTFSGSRKAKTPIKGAKSFSKDMR